MQFVSFFGMPLQAITKGQSSLWLALMGLFFSSILCAQRVDVIDQKGTKASTGVEFTEGVSPGFTNSKLGDLWRDPAGTAHIYGLDGSGNDTWIPLVKFLNDVSDVTIASPANNEVLSYDASSLTWVNKSLAELKTIEIVNDASAYNDQNPLIIGLTNSNPLQGGSTSSSRFKSPDDADIYIIDKSNNQVYVVLGPLDADYDGKIIRIVEADNENPLISTTNSSGTTTSHYDSSNTDDNYLFNKDLARFTGAAVITKNIQYEFVDFVWVNDEGKWIPMR